jgi:hypothetical protein
MTGTEDHGENSLGAVLGVGIMGSAMARNLIVAGRRTAVWDRSGSASAALADAGALAAASPEEAVKDARVVITMLPTGDVVNAVVFNGVAGALPRAPHGRRWARSAWARAWHGRSVPGPGPSELARRPGGHPAMLGHRCAPGVAEPGPATLRIHSRHAIQDQPAVDDAYRHPVR